MHSENSNTSALALLKGRKYVPLKDALDAVLSAEGVLTTDAAYLSFRDSWKKKVVKAIESGQLAAIDNLKGRPPSVWMPDESRYLITGDVEAWYLAEICQQKSQEPTRVSEISTPSSFHPPINKDDWFDAIRDTANAFQEEFRRFPNEVQLWARLQTCPAGGYGIKATKNTVTMGDKKLTHSAFRKRWKRYTEPSKH